MDGVSVDLLVRELARLTAGRWCGGPEDRAVELLDAYLAAVRQWNERVNLTAITGEREMVVKHVLDSATVLGAVELRPGQRLLDVGSGAGFPGVVLKILCPEVAVDLLESLGKRCRFLEHVRAKLVALGLRGAEDGLRVLQGRAEDWGRRPGHREGYDVVVARAVATMRVLAEYCLPFVRVGGLFVAMKGPGVEEELGAAGRALGVLGGEVDRVVEVELPEGAGRRNLVVVRKVAPVPEAYPRKAGVPERRPL